MNKLIKQKFTPTQLHIFKKRTIFGHFVDLDLVVCSALVYYFLLREVADNMEDAMSFNIGNTIVTFSKIEFLLITGFWQPSGTVVQKKVPKIRFRI